MPFRTKCDNITLHDVSIFLQFLFPFFSVRAVTVVIQALLGTPCFRHANEVGNAVGICDAVQRVSHFKGNLSRFNFACESTATNDDAETEMNL